MGPGTGRDSCDRGWPVGLLGGPGQGSSDGPSRSLAKRPLFSGVAIFVLALGIGATTAIFTLVDAVVLSPLPFDESGPTHGRAARGTGTGDGRRRPVRRLAFHLYRRGPVLPGLGHVHGLLGFRYGQGEPRGPPHPSGDERSVPGHPNHSPRWTDLRRGGDGSGWASHHHVG